jgi:predicted transcriptional regulator YdeE
MACDWRDVVGLAAFALACATTVAQGAKGMNPEILQVQGFTVVGISVRTDNAKEATPAGVIGKLWGRLTQENLLAKIPNRVDENIVAVYTDYASDNAGEYTFILGAKVSRNSEIPAGMVAAKVLTGKYAEFTSERGPANRVVPEIWQKINGLPKSAPGGDRAYRSDFEVYDQRARNPQDAVVSVFVGIR